jgi:hypothetical protein
LAGAGLPDGLFSNQKFKIWGGLSMKNVLYFMTNNLEPFGVIYGRLI